MTHLQLPCLPEFVSPSSSIPCSLRGLGWPIHSRQPRGRGVAEHSKKYPKNLSREWKWKLSGSPNVPYDTIPIRTRVSLHLLSACVLSAVVTFSGVVGVFKRAFCWMATPNAH